MTTQAPKRPTVHVLPGGRTDAPIPFPAPAGGACWPPRRVPPPDQPWNGVARSPAVAKRLDELACAVEAMEPTDAQRHTGDDIERRLRQAYATGHDNGERKGNTEGWRWGLVCGVVVTIAVAATVVIIAAGAGWLSVDVPAVQPMPVVTA